MSRCDRCREDYKHMVVEEIKDFKGGSLTVTDIPVQKCSCGELMELGAGVIIDGYCELLQEKGIIGKLTISLDELQKKYDVDDFLPQSTSNA